MPAAKTSLLTVIRRGSLPEDLPYQTENAAASWQMMQDFYGQKGFLLPWVGYHVWEEDQIIGLASFVGAPEHEIVEISYWIFPEFEKRGWAKKACAALCEMAHKNDTSIRIQAKTLPAENASTKVLLANGFVQVGTAIDEEVGEAWLWERR